MFPQMHEALAATPETIGAIIVSDSQFSTRRWARIMSETPNGVMLRALHPAEDLIPLTVAGMLQW